MKKYVFFTMNIGGINGAEQYIYNKMTFLKQCGYQVFIFSGRPEKILIDGFREYEDLVCSALRFYPYCLNKSAYEKTKAWIVSRINLQAEDTCIIESSNVTSALWGEQIAKALGCRHLAIIMQEHHNYCAAMRKFLAYKLDRHELAGIMDDSVGKMLKNPKISLRPDMVVRAFCNNVVQVCEDRFSHLLNRDADYTFASIGRLEKEYVLPFIDALTAYFKENTQKRYNLLLIGGCADKRRLRLIREKIAQCANVTLTETGQLYPIPRALVKRADLFISTAGSSTVSFYENVPTIRIHHVDAAPMGIIGYDYIIGGEQPPMRLENRTLSECIEQALDPTTPIQFVRNFEETYYERMHAEFSRHLHFGDAQTEQTYYDTRTIRYTSLQYKICSYVCRIFGVKITYFILECIRKLVRGEKD